MTKISIGALALAVVLSVIATPPAEAQTYTVLHNFAGPPADGALPSGFVIGDPAGNLYGTTGWGGALSKGVVFKVDPNGNETVLHSFAGGPADGANPYAGVVRDFAGNLYGTTYVGGASDLGIVFKLSSTATKPYCTASPVDQPTGHIPRLRLSETLRATSTVQLFLAALQTKEWCLSWIRPARLLSCTASRDHPQTG